MNTYVVLFLLSFPFIIQLMLACFLIYSLMAEHINNTRVEMLFIVVRLISGFFIIIGTILPYFGLVHSLFDMPNNYGYAFALAGWIMFPLVVKRLDCLTTNPQSGS